MYRVSKKKVLFILSACIIFVMGITSYSDSKQYKIIINQKELATSSQPFNSGGRIMVPMRDIFEALEAKVDWDPKARTVTAKKENDIVELTIDSNVSKVNGKIISLDVPAIIKQGRTFVPVRFIAESLNMDVSWQKESNSVIINSFKATNTPFPKATETPLPTQTPTYIPADIKVLINGNELDCKSMGNCIIVKDGVLLGNAVISAILGIEIDYFSKIGEDQLKKRSDGTYLKTRAVDKRWVPIIEAARELNYQVEFKNNILTINGNDYKDNDDGYFLDKTIPVKVSIMHATTPLASQGGVTVLAICNATVIIEIQKEEGYERLKSLDDYSVKKIIYDFYQNNESLKECTYINCSVNYNGNKCFQMNIIQGQPMDNASFQRLI